MTKTDYDVSQLYVCKSCGTVALLDGEIVGKGADLRGCMGGKHAWVRFNDTSKLTITARKMRFAYLGLDDRGRPLSDK